MHEDAAGVISAMLLESISKLASAGETRQKWATKSPGAILNSEAGPKGEGQEARSRKRSLHESK
ncbi:MAG: hypothetical protein A2W28_04640 [Gammaproteobacteria bacterium RBG_16_51_14]|nr:MAG: hypothetical protein A2W28_04640 [Gammaproteobacteria bacterium RBG_16_51_14]